MPWYLYFMSALYILAGAMHFAKPKTYLRIMPPIFPAPLLLVYLSGVAEMVLGAGLLAEELRPWAAWGVIVLLIAVFPANIYMYQQRARFSAPGWALMARLPLQFVLMAWAYFYT
jgi:uncharacterized membrane protein